MSWPAHLGALLTGLLLQMTVVPGFGPGGGRPDLVLIWVLAASVFESRHGRAVVIAAAGGLLLDLAGGRFIGLNVMLFIGAALVTRRVLRAFLRPSVSLSMVMTLGLSLAIELVRAVLWLSGIPRGILGITSVAVTSALYSGLLMVAVFYAAASMIKFTHWENP